MEFEIESELSQVEKLEGQGKNIFGSRELFNEIGTSVYGAYQNRFATSGGGSWPKGSSEYRAKKAQDLASGKIQYNEPYKRTGMLFRSLTQRENENAIYEQSETELRIGSRVVYQEYLIGLIPEEQQMVNGFEGILQRVIEDNFNRIAGG